MGKRGEPKEKLVRLLSTYKSRRDNYSYKIKMINRQIKATSQGEYAKQEEISRIAIKYMEEFNGLKLQNTHDNSSRTIKNSISCVVKWTLENKGSSRYLAKYFGYSDSSQLYKIRLKFNKTFNNTPENKVFYYRFLDHIKSQTNESLNSK